MHFILLFSHHNPYNKMSHQKIILYRKKNIQNILDSCQEYSKRYARVPRKSELPRLSKSYTPNPEKGEEDEESQQQYHSSNRAKIKLSTPMNLNYSIEKHEFDMKRLKAEPFCGSVHISRPNKELFRHVVHKYKRHFHPSNASRGESNTSDEPIIKTPRKIRELRERYHTEENENELRRMVVLNQVINENNRREIRLRRQQSLMKQKLLE